MRTRWEVEIGMEWRGRTEDISSPVGQRTGPCLQELLCGLVEPLLLALKGGIAFDLHGVLKFEGAVVCVVQNDSSYQRTMKAHLPVLADWAIHNDGNVELR